MPVDPYSSPTGTVQIHPKDITLYHVHFKEGVTLPPTGPLNPHFDATDDQGWKQVKKKIPTINFGPAFPGATAASLERLYGPNGPAGSLPRRVNLLQTRLAQVPHGTPVQTVRAAFAQWPAVQSIFPLIRLSRPYPNWPAPYPPNAFFAQQYYGLEAPFGVDATFVRQWIGGDGKGQTVIDLEGDWDINHSDLLGAGGLPRAVVQGNTPPTGLPNDLDHGTFTLGVICANQDGKDITGLAAGVKHIFLFSDGASIFGVTNALQALLDTHVVGPPPGTAKYRGTVLVIECQGDDGSGLLLPVEHNPAIQQQIITAVAAGITVVLAAGNGNTDLDTYADFFTKPGSAVQTFKPGGKGYIDSGAIYVAAAQYHNGLAGNSGWLRFSPSNFGKRIDCFAQGDAIPTLRPGGGVFNTFNWTSAATAIIGGTAVCLQGLAAHRPLLSQFVHHHLTPAQMRDYLRDDAQPGNTRSNVPLTDRIGVMPNLRRLALQRLGYKLEFSITSNFPKKTKRKRKVPKKKGKAS